MLKIVLLLLLCLIASACETVLYYGQAVKGQAELLIAREPITDILARKEGPQEGGEDRLQERLRLLLKIRRFAESDLSLEVGNSYGSYVDLKRKYATWVVISTKEFSLKPVAYCFPVAGCVSYRGYFSKESAETYGGNLRQDGLDVYIRGVSAYSTLGWFDDPVLSSFVWYKEENLVNLIYHELAHKVLYVKDDTRFNESFATAVGGEGAKRWFNNKNDSASLERLIRKNRIHARFIDHVEKYKKRLGHLYTAQNLSEQEKRKQKKEIFTEMVSEYEIIKAEEWDDYKGYDNWFYDNLNNAKLAGVADYNELVPAFNTILADLDGTLPQFNRRGKELADLPKEERNKELDRIRQ